nr:putative ribonuclease H-like domain-containing protein [Tanacetum cinerariifolium]
NSYASRDIHKHNAQMKYSRIPLHKVSAAAPSTSQPVLIATARTFSAVKPKISKARPNVTPYAVSKSKSPFRKPFIQHTSPKPSISPPRVNAANPSAVSAARVNADHPSAVSAARVNTAKLSAVRAARINAGNPQQALKDKGVINSGCSRHMTGNMSYLSDFEELNGGYVAFGGNPKGGKITGKGKIKTGKLDFDDVYYVKELKFNLFSVSQILPSIGFMRPSGCPVTILNTLDPLGKFQGKVDEGFLVGYSVCSKAFRVFNSRTRIVQETLHVNFMENKPNVAGSGPAWLFDIDSLSQTMNYHSVLTENQTNSNAGFKDLNREFAECINSSSNGVSAAGLDFTNSTNDFTAADPLVSVAELNFTNNTNDFSAAGPSNAAMPNLEDLSHNADDVGAEADTNNMESEISVSPIPTSRIHKDHPTSQIIGDLSSTTQTRSMARAVRDQGSGPAWLFDIDSLFQTMNYHPVLAENQSNPTAGFQDAEKAGEEGTQTYVLFPVLSDGSTNPKNNKDAHTGGNEHNDDIQKYVSPDIHSSSCGDQAREQGDKAMNKDKGKNPIVTITGFRDLNEEFAECINNSSNGGSVAGPLVSAAGLDFTNSTNDFTAAGLLVSAAELNFINSTNDFSVAGPSNATMPNLEDFSHNADDVGAEADTNNMESIISVYRNKKDERGIVIRNKARLVAQGHTQKEGIDYEEVFSSVASIEAIRLFLAYASFMGFLVYQMDVKSGFLYGTIEKEVYVYQPPGFEDPEHPDKVYKVVKALYGLHQAPRA